MAVKRATAEAGPVLWRIGEVAKLTGVTTRTLRYWEELGLLQPASRTEGGERVYGAGDVRRVTRIRDWQELLGFSLDEVKTVLSTGDVDVLDRVHFELREGDLLARRVTNRQRHQARAAGVLRCLAQHPAGVAVPGRPQRVRLP